MFKLPSQLVHFQKWLAFSHSLYEAGCLGEFNGSEPARDLQESRIQSTESVKTFCLRHFCFAESCQVSLWVPILAWTTSTITLPIAKACNICPLSFIESIRRRLLQISVISMLSKSRSSNGARVSVGASLL